MEDAESISLLATYVVSIAVNGRARFETYHKYPSQRKRQAPDVYLVEGRLRSGSVTKKPRWVLAQPRCSCGASRQPQRGRAKTIAPCLDIYFGVLLVDVWSEQSPVAGYQCPTLQSAQEKSLNPLLASRSSILLSFGPPLQSSSPSGRLSGWDGRTRSAIGELY